MKTSTLWLMVGLTASVSGQSNNLLSVLISDAVSIFTSVTSVVGSQVSAASASQLASAISTSDSSTTSTSTTPSSTSSTSYSLTSSSSTITSAPTAASSSAGSAAGNNTNNGHHDRNLAIILGTVLGALVLAFLVLFLLLFCRRRRQRARKDGTYKGYNSSSDDIVAQEKSLRPKQDSSSIRSQPRTFQRYHRGPQSVHSTDRYPNDIPAAHGMSDEPFMPGVPTYSQDGRMHNHDRDGLMSFDEKHSDYGHHERIPAAAAAGGISAAALRENDRAHSRNSRASNIVPDEYPYHSIQPPARSPHRLSMDAAERRRRSASLGRERVRTPTHHTHEPMPRSTGLAAGALAGTALSRDKRRSRSQPRNDPVPSGLVSPMMRSEDSTAVHEMGDSSDDRDIDRLRRTGTLSQGPKTRPIAELHELSSTGSSNIVPTLSNLNENHKSVNNNHQHAYPQYLSAAAPTMERTDNLHPAPLNESQWMHKGAHDERSDQVVPVGNQYTKPLSHGLNSHPTLEAQPISARTHTPNFQQPGNGSDISGGSSLVSGILKIRDQSNERPIQSSTTRPPLLNRTSTEERRRLRARRRSSPGYNHPITSGSSSSNTEAITPRPNSELSYTRPISQSNISQPLHPRSNQPQQQSLYAFNTETVPPTNHHEATSTNTKSSYQPRPQLFAPHLANEFNNIPDQGAIGRWNSRGRWKSTENIHDDVVGQAL